eukprot:187437-Rhodomonas_salina.2
MSTRPSVMEASTSLVTPWPNWKGTWACCQGTGTGTGAGCGITPACSGVAVSMPDGVFGSSNWQAAYLSTQIVAPQDLLQVGLVLPSAPVQPCAGSDS